MDECGTRGCFDAALQGFKVSKEASSFDSSIRHDDNCKLFINMSPEGEGVCLKRDVYLFGCTGTTLSSREIRLLINGTHYIVSLQKNIFIYSFLLCTEHRKKYY